MTGLMTAFWNFNTVGHFIVRL